jgi:hypothetical protein
MCINSFLYSKMTTQIQSYQEKRQAHIQKMEEMEAQLLTMYKEHVAEVLSGSDFFCVVEDTAGIETTRAIQGEIFNHGDSHKELNLRFIFPGNIVEVKLFNGNTGCEYDCDSKEHSHMDITLDNHKVEYCSRLDGFGSDDREKEELLDEIANRFGDDSALVLKCIHAIWNNLDQLSI